MNDTRQILWIGLNDIENEGDYKYIDGSNFEQNINKSGIAWIYNISNNEDRNCVSITYNKDDDISSFIWTDNFCNKSLMFICNECNNGISTTIYDTVMTQKKDTDDNNGSIKDGTHLNTAEIVLIVFASIVGIILLIACIGGICFFGYTLRE